jgi:hypothetical protein
VFFFVAVVISLAGVLTDRERGHVGIALIRPAALTLGRIGHYLRDALVASPANEYNGRRHGSREGKEDFFLLRNSPFKSKFDKKISFVIEKSTKILALYQIIFGLNRFAMFTAQKNSKLSLKV